VSNTGHLKFRKRITLSNFHYWLQRALNPRPYWGRSPWTFQGKEPS